APYRAADGGNIELRGDDLTLQPSTAMSLALVMHELTTNAAKYGSLSCLTGKLSVTWTVTSESDVHEVILEWRESGGPAVAPPTRRGFGRTLLEQIYSADAAGGQILVDFVPTGL